jgi:hypothetical protein
MGFNSGFKGLNDFDIANFVPNNVPAPAKYIINNDRCCIQTFFNSTHRTVSKEFNVLLVSLGLSQSVRRHVSPQFDGLRKGGCIAHFMSNFLLFHNYISQVVFYLNCQLRTRLTQDH